MSDDRIKQWHPYSYRSGKPHTNFYTIKGGGFLNKKGTTFFNKIVFNPIKQIEI